MAIVGRRFFVQDSELYPEASHHKDAIDALYSVDLNKTNEGLLRLGAEKQVVFVCFSNRSGSNLLLDTLSRIGFGCKPGNEPFNDKAITSFAKEFKFQSFEEYLEFVIQMRGLRGSVFLKIGARQLFWLANSGILSKYLPSARFVTVERHDKVSQAVSLYIADSTRTYMKLANDDRSEARAIAYSSEEILRRLMRIVDTAMWFQYFYSIHSISSPVVRYENLDSDPIQVVQQMMSELGLAHDLPPQWEEALKAQPPGIVRQSDDLNREFAQRFRNEFSINSFDRKEQQRFVSD